MQKHVIFGIGGLVIGLAGGFLGANAINRNATQQAATANIPAITGTADGSAAAAQSGGMQPDVAEILDRAQAEPQNFAVQMMTGDMYNKIGKFDKALEYYERGIAIKPEDFQANIVTANAYFDSRNFEKAADYYTKALLINPKDVNARTDLGTTFVERPNPDYDRAIKEFHSALEIDPKHAPTLYYLAIANFRKGDRPAAEKILADLEKTDPTNELVGRLKQNLAGN
jgi:tetratricopeptide (TPR) repeat protein